MSAKKQEPVLTDRISDLFRTGVRAVDESKDSLQLFRFLDSRVGKDLERARCVFVLGFSDKTVKIGVSHLPLDRSKIISMQSGREIVKEYVTGPVRYPFKIKAGAKRLLKQYSVKGDFFSSAFAKTVQVIKGMVWKELRNENQTGK
jgi:hypothetical protein